MTIRKFFGIICLIWAVVFVTLETAHFGNNWSPQSSEELICDLTSIIILVAGYLLIRGKVC